SEVGGALGAGCVLRRDGADNGELSEVQPADSDHHRTLRWRPTGRVRVLQAAYGEWFGGSESESLSNCGTVGSRCDANPSRGDRGVEICGGKRAGPEQAAQRVVRLDDEGWREAGISEETHRVLSDGRRGVEVCG